jgi:hypothetical protein
MENATVIEPDYWGALVQWVLFFGFFTILILPAFLYKKLARRFNKKEWLYFVWGIPVGVLGLNFVHLYARFVNHYAPPDLFERARYLWLLSMYVMGYLFVWGAYKMLLAHLIKKDKQERPD